MDSSSILMQAFGVNSLFELSFGSQFMAIFLSRHKLSSDFTTEAPQSPHGQQNLQQQLAQLNQEIQQTKATWIEPGKAKMIYQNMTATQRGLAEENQLTQSQKIQIRDLQVALSACQEGNVVTYPLVFAPAQLA